MDSDAETHAAGCGRRRAALRRRLGRCLGLPTHAEPSAAAPRSPPRGSSAASPASSAKPRGPPPPSPAHSWSDTEVLTPLTAAKDSRRARRRRSADGAHSPTALLQSPQSLRRAAGHASASSSSSSSSSSSASARKGVQYARDGGLLCCRFCDILRARDEPFLYEDEELAVFRPLAPAAESHILVVPRCHIRNVNQLTGRDSPLLERMRRVAKLVLRDLPPRAPAKGARHKRPHAHTASSSSSGSTSSLPSPPQAEAPPAEAEGEDEEQEQEKDDVRFKLAFHAPPFNSIDHVHMHAFRMDQQSVLGCVGAIKYRTATWWCRSFDEVMARLDADGAPRAHKKTKRSVRRRRAQDEPRAGCRFPLAAAGEEEAKDEHERPAALCPQIVI